MKYTLNQPSVKQAVIAHIQSIDVTKKPIFDVEIKPFRKNRTLLQNNYYFSTVVPMMANWYGDSTEDMHEYLKRKFLTPKIVTINGFTFEIVPSTKDLSTVDFNSYIELCCRHAAQDMGLYIPQPNERLI